MVYDIPTSGGRRRRIGEPKQYPRRPEGRSTRSAQLRGFVRRVHQSGEVDQALSGLTPRRRRVDRIRPFATGCRQARARLELREDLQVKASVRACASDFRPFEDWCTERGLSHLPASPNTLARYVTHLADTGKKVSTIRRGCSVRQPPIHPVEDRGRRVPVHGSRLQKDNAPTNQSSSAGSRKAPGCPLRVHNLAEPTCLRYAARSAGVRLSKGAVS